MEEKEEKKEKEESKEIFLRADIQTDINGNTRGPRGHKKLFYAHKISAYMYSNDFSVASRIDLLSKDGIIIPENARKLKNAILRQKKIVFWGSQLLINAICRITHFKPRMFPRMPVPIDFFFKIFLQIKMLSSSNYPPPHNQKQSKSNILPLKSNTRPPIKQRFVSSTSSS